MGRLGSFLVHPRRLRRCTPFIPASRARPGSPLPRAVDIKLKRRL